MMTPSLDTLVDRLELQAHPEGGYYRETWRADREVGSLPDFPGPREAASAILYLLPAGERSAWHRLRAEEIWLHQRGDPVVLETRSEPEAPVRERTIGGGERLQAAVEAGVWQRAAVRQGGTVGWGLVGCVTVPGFNVEDFEMDDSLAD